MRKWEIEKRGHLTASDIVRRDGWTRSMVNKLLTADKAVRMPPRWTECPLYSIEQVERVEASEAFTTAAAEAERRAANRAEQAERRAAEIWRIVRDYGNECKIAVVSRKELRNAAMNYAGGCNPGIELFLIHRDLIEYPQESDHAEYFALRKSATASERKLIDEMLTEIFASKIAEAYPHLQKYL